MKNEIYQYYSSFENQENLDLNYEYYKTLFDQYCANTEIDILLKDTNNDSNVVPLPIASDEERTHIVVQDYENLPEEISKKLKDYTLCICKMQAGLGSSLKRDDLLKKFTKRTQLGAKGTDLFINYDGHFISLAEVQLQLARKTAESGIYQAVVYQNLVNDETDFAVKEIWNNDDPFSGKKYAEVFSSNELSFRDELFQLKMPTIAESGGISFDRIAPAGHAYLGFSEILKIFNKDEVENEILVIGNGEDIKSTPDAKILSWVADNDIPITMITTTKLEEDKKGGQLAIVNEAKPYVAIVEKAQAEKANQLTYFEELGLREGDARSLFNTNIVVINKKALKEKLQEANISAGEIKTILSPDLIKNVKEQDGKKFTQLEGAIGSTVLNLDKYFRQNHNGQLISFLNLAPENRRRFFVPIKKREDFDQIYGCDTVN